MSDDIEGIDWDYRKKKRHSDGYEIIPESPEFKKWDSENVRSLSEKIAEGKEQSATKKTESPLLGSFQMVNASVTNRTVDSYFRWVNCIIVRVPTKILVRTQYYKIIDISELLWIEEVMVLIGNRLSKPIDAYVGRMNQEWTIERVSDEEMRISLYPCKREISTEEKSAIVDRIYMKFWHKNVSG